METVPLRWDLICHDYVLLIANINNIDNNDRICVIMLSERIVQANTELWHEADRLRFRSLPGGPRVWSGVDQTL